MTYGVAMLIKPLDEGMSFVDLANMYDMMNGVEVIPYEVQGEASVAMGFINCYDAELIDYQYTEGSALYEFIKSILDDQNLETEDGNYVLVTDEVNLDIYLGYEPAECEVA